MTSLKENPTKSLNDTKIGNRLLKERVPCCSVEDKYIDALIKRDSSSLSLDLALLLAIIRFEAVPPLSELSKLFHREEVEIECSLHNLSEIGFLTFS